jgi:predicted dehydrogenase
MLDDAGGGMDAVTISTPDHGHAPIAIRAMRMGLHCFCQKPLTHTIHEARLVSEVARQTGVATQMGNQGTASSSLRQAAAFVQGGGLGDVREIHVWTNRPAWPQGIDRPSATYSVPDTLDWDVWIGPAPMRPYAPDYHPFQWRGWWDFGGGPLGDMGSHTANLPYAACDLRAPSTVQAITSGHNRETYPAWSVITWEFPATDVRPEVKLRWYDGGRLPPDEILAGAKKGLRSSGAALIGSKGTLYAPGDFVTEVEWIGSEKIPDVDFVRSPGHFREWVDAIRGGRAAMSNFPDYAGPLTETILLGNVAVWAATTADSAGKKIWWDAERMQATNAAEVMPIVRKEYRQGFELEG